MDTHVTMTSISSKDGLLLEGAIVMPVNNKVIGTIIVHPATGLKKEFYLRFARFLAAESYRVILYDYRGMGGSRNVPLREVQATMLDWAVLDMNGVLNFVVDRYPGPVFWVGHSIGGQLMALMDNSHAITRVIAVNSSSGFWKTFSFPFNLYSYFLWKVYLPLTIPLFGYAPISKYGLGADIPAGVGWQWAEWCCSEGHFADAVRALTGHADFPQFRRPISALSATDDFIATSENVDHLLTFYPAAPKRKKMVSPSAVGLKKIGHTGFFRRENGGQLWPLILKEIERPAEAGEEAAPFIPHRRPAVPIT